MKTFYRSALAFLVLAFSLTAYAQKPALVENTDEPGRTPFQEFENACNGLETSCSVDIEPVPAGYRLVITHVLFVAKLVQPEESPTSHPIWFYKTQFIADATARWMVMPTSDHWLVLDTSTLIFLEPGSQPHITIQLGNPGQGTFTLAGYYIKL